MFSPYLRVFIPFLWIDSSPYMRVYRTNFLYKVQLIWKVDLDSKTFSLLYKFLNQTIKARIGKASTSKGDSKSSNITQKLKLPL